MRFLGSLRRIRAERQRQEQGGGQQSKGRGRFHACSPDLVGIYFLNVPSMKQVLKDFQKFDFQKFWAARRKRFAVLFFLLGFCVDIFTLRRIDNPLIITRHAVSLVILGGILSAEVLENQNALRLSGFRARFWAVKDSVWQFLFGSLMSAFTIFYFKSASFWSSLGFAAVLAGLMILNH